MYRTAIFDLDGTLLDTLQDLAAAGNHALSAMGLPTHPPQAYRTMVGSGIPSLIRRMLPAAAGGKGSFEIAKTLFENYYSAHMQDLTSPYPGIVPMLARLKEAGMVLGVFSNKADVYTKKMVEDYFPGVFNAVLGLVEGTPPKPDSAGTFRLMAELAARTESTLYIGDSDVDILTAKNAGLTSCGVSWGFRSREELELAGADHLVADAEALETLLMG